MLQDSSMKYSNDTGADKNLLTDTKLPLARNWKSGCVHRALGTSGELGRPKPNEAKLSYVNSVWLNSQDFPLYYSVVRSHEDINIPSVKLSQFFRSQMTEDNIRGFSGHGFASQKVPRSSDDSWLRCKPSKKSQSNFSIVSSRELIWSHGMASPLHSGVSPEEGEGVLS